VVVLNTLMSVTAQNLMRNWRGAAEMAVLGERLTRTGRVRLLPFRTVHRWLTAPLHHAAGIVGIGRWATEELPGTLSPAAPLQHPLSLRSHTFPRAAAHARSGVEITFLFCGQMIARKGLDNLLAAFAQLDPRARLLLVGREAELPQMLALLPVEVRAHIEYAGFQAPDDLPRSFPKPTFSSTKSLRWLGRGGEPGTRRRLADHLLEYGRRRLDLVTEGDNGRIFPAGDTERLCTAMQHFLDHPEDIDQYGDASRARAPQWQPAEARRNGSPLCRASPHENPPRELLFRLPRCGELFCSTRPRARPPRA